MNDAVIHFMKRAQNYNVSASWVDDKVLIRKIRDLAKAKREDCVLDIGIGTGKVARAFHGRVYRVVGVDICDNMVRHARKCADQLILSSAERLPFKENIFSLCVCRQGLQFMELQDVLGEIERVLKPGGKVVLCHLTAYGKEDKKETFLIQKLRNSARKNFFLPEDISCLLGKRFHDIESFEYISRESVNRWIDNAAISKYARGRIKSIYKNASEDFKKIHRVEFEKDDIFDSMKMVIVRANKEG